jgi:hypothetical protein
MERIYVCEDTGRGRRYEVAEANKERKGILIKKSN